MSVWEGGEEGRREFMARDVWRSSTAGGGLTRETRLWASSTLVCGEGVGPSISSNNGVSPVNSTRLHVLCCGSSSTGNPGRCSASSMFQATVIRVESSG